jgi:hypothetical protein
VASADGELGITQSQARRLLWAQRKPQSTGLAEKLQVHLPEQGRLAMTLRQGSSLSPPRLVPLRCLPAPESRSGLGRTRVSAGGAEKAGAPNSPTGTGTPSPAPPAPSAAPPRAGPRAPTPSGCHLPDLLLLLQPPPPVLMLREPSGFQQSRKSGRTGPLPPPPPAFPPPTPRRTPRRDERRPGRSVARAGRWGGALGREAGARGRSGSGLPPCPRVPPALSPPAAG